MMNAELTSEERDLIAAAREGGDPTEMQKVRLRRSLDAKIAAGVEAPVFATSAGFLTLLKVGAGVAIAAALGGGAIYFAVPRLSAPSLAPKSLRARPPHLLVPAPRPEPDMKLPPVAPVAPAAEAPSPPSPAKVSLHRREISRPATAPADLAGELGLLTQVNAATRKGDAAQADELLRMYDNRYPSGQLAQERAAAGVLAHCAAGRAERAHAEASRFLERWPRSPLVARIRASCAGEDKAP